MLAPTAEQELCNVRHDITTIVLFSKKGRSCAFAWTKNEKTWPNPTKHERLHHNVEKGTQGKHQCAKVTN
jgi:hypothetical protein